MDIIKFSYIFFYQLNQEIDQLNRIIMDTKLKMGTCQLYDQVYLTQVNTPMLKIDPYLNENNRK